ncbi:MAG: hypothetical protein ACJAZS_000640, partial [Alteromonas naphthalenivorans]
MKKTLSLLLLLSTYHFNTHTKPVTKPTTKSKSKNTKPVKQVQANPA